MPSTRINQKTQSYLKLILSKDKEGALHFVGGLADSKKYSLLDLFELMSAAQHTIGKMWAKGTITVADEHFATKVTLEAIVLISQKMKVYHRTKKGNALLANFVEGEFHTVGLKMFAELLRSEGWGIEFYSSKLSVAELFKHIQTTGSSFDLICISLTMEFNLTDLQSVLKILRTNTLTRNCKILVGSQLFRSKRYKDSLTDAETGLPLADCQASNFAEGLHFVESISRSSTALL